MGFQCSNCIWWSGNTHGCRNINYCYQHSEWLGMNSIDRKGYIMRYLLQNIKEEDAIKMNKPYAYYAYDILKHDTHYLDAIYEDYIIKLIGEYGLDALKENGLIESCGSINGRKLYSLIEVEKWYE